MGGNHAVCYTFCEYLETQAWKVFVGLAKKRNVEKQAHSLCG